MAAGPDVSWLDTYQWLPSTGTDSFGQDIDAISQLEMCLNSVSNVRWDPSYSPPPMAGEQSLQLDEAQCLLKDLLADTDTPMTPQTRALRDPQSGRDLAAQQAKMLPRLDEQPSNSSVPNKLKNSFCFQEQVQDDHTSPCSSTSSQSDDTIEVFVDKKASSSLENTPSPPTRRSSERMGKPRAMTGRRSKTRGSGAVVNKSNLNRAHCEVERRYRNGINEKLRVLEEALLSSQLQVVSSQSGDEQNGDAVGRKRRGKSNIISDATDYIYTAEVEIRHLACEIRQFQEKLRALEKGTFT